MKCHTCDRSISRGSSLLLVFVLPRLQHDNKHLQHQAAITRLLLSNIFSSMSVQYPVFLTRFHLGMQDPHASGPRYHTTIFVASEADGSGILHQVTGDISSPRGMYYYPNLTDPPEHSETFYSKEQLGVTDASTHPDSWRRILNQLPAPPLQKAFNMKTRQTEPFKTMNPLVFYEPGEERKPLVKCTEWTLDTAIPALKSAGLIRDIDGSSPVD